MSADTDPIDELGDRRNVAARTLVMRRSQTLGVVTIAPQLVVRQSSAAPA